MPAPYLFVLIFGALVAGIYLERGRALWQRQKWLAKPGARGPRSGRNLFPFRKRAFSPAVDAAEQLRIVIEAKFKKRPLLSRAEAHVLYAAEKVIREAKPTWRVMAQVSLGEILSSPDASAYAAINSKRVDLLIISRTGLPIAAIEYQGEGHYQGSAAARDAVKKEALRKAGVRYVEVTAEHDRDEVEREVMRVVGLEQETEKADAPLD